MSYTKREWATGNVVGAVDLNRIEDRIANIDVGYSCTEEWVTLTDESVTTVKPNESAQSAGNYLAYSEPITADTIKVTFNGTEYECNKQTHDLGFTYYGTNTMPRIGEVIDWSEFPFEITDYQLFTETAGTYQVKIEAYEKTTETSECFDRARGYSCSGGVTLITSETINSESIA